MEDQYGMILTTMSSGPRIILGMNFLKFSSYLTKECLVVILFFKLKCTQMEDQYGMIPTAMSSGPRITLRMKFLKFKANRMFLVVVQLLIEYWLID